MEWSESSSKKEVYSNKRPFQETRKVSNKQPILTPKGTRKRREKTKTTKLVEGKKL